VEVRRLVAPRNAVEASKRLDELVLQFLYSHEWLSSHAIINEIFSTHGFSPSIEMMEKLLEKLEKGGYVRKEKKGLVSMYSLTERGKAAVGKAGRVSFPKV
jgi:DNA-binding PadR family transcriptional regulator